MDNEKPRVTHWEEAGLEFAMPAKKPACSSVPSSPRELCNPGHEVMATHETNVSEVSQCVTWSRGGVPCSDALQDGNTVTVYFKTL